jgi:folate-binding protein YgfZ
MSLTFARLDSRALIAVGGADWRSFLQGLLTQDVDTLPSGEARFAALLTPQGRLLWDLLVIGREDGCWLDVEAQARDAIIQRLTMYRLRAKVEIAADETPVSALFAGDPEAIGLTARPLRLAPAVRSTSPASGGGPERQDAPPLAGELSPEATEGAFGISGGAEPGGEHRFIPDPRLPQLGWRGYGVELPHGATVADEAAYDAHRLALGVPGPADWGSDRTYPIEANFDLLHGIDFKKGCFVGQETTSRMKRRGQVKSRMLPIAFAGPPPSPGAEVLAGELRAGEVRSGREGSAMALLRLDRIAGELRVEGRPVRVERPVWLAEAADAPI